MKRIFTVAALFLTVALVSMAAVTLITTTATPAAAAGGCRCPLIYAPVICDHGKIYPNQCEADCHNARNCVPYGYGF